MRHSAILVLLCAALLAAPGCKSGKKLFTPEAVPPAPPQSEGQPGGSDANKTQPIGSEGFGEKPLSADAGAAGAGKTQEMPGGVTPDQVEAALKPVYFDYDSEGLGDAALGVLSANAQWLKAHPGVRVQVEGHCDERGTIEYNLALGQRRARSVKDHLVRLGVAGDRLDLISYGKERPAVDGHDEAAWAKNRRVEFRALGS